MSKDLFFEMREKEAMNERLQLREDVYSHFVKKGAKEAEPYGRKGEQVTLVDDRGNTLLVKSKSGEVFPVEKPKTLSHVQN